VFITKCGFQSDEINLAVAHLNLALVLGRIGRVVEAKAVLRVCAELDGAGLRDPRTHNVARVTCLFHLGRFAMEQGKLQEAVEVFLEAVQKRPHYYAPQVTLGFSIFSNNGLLIIVIHQHI
jgi:tetratricopeptide (TPR) repeat protein